MSHVQHFYPLMLCVKSWPATSVAGHFSGKVREAAPPTIPSFGSASRRRAAQCFDDRAAGVRL